MKLKHVNIINFRSIENIKIDFDPLCRTLVGINESGKSNILRALALLDEDEDMSPEDVREPTPKEKSIEEAYVRFVFSMNEDEIQDTIDASLEKVLGKDTALLKTGNKKLTLSEFCRTRKTEELYDINLIDEDRNSSHWRIAGYTVEENWISRNNNDMKEALTVLLNDNFVLMI